MGLGFFFAVFFPGLLVGGWSSYLVLRLWSDPVTFLDSSEREVSLMAAPMMEKEALQLDRPLLGPGGRRSERRHVLDYSSANGCNVTAHLSAQPRVRSLTSEPISGGPYLLLVLIHSSPTALEMRNAIRETWLKDNQKQERFAGRFVIGLAELTPADLALLSCENIKHADILFLPDIVEPTKARDFSSSEKLLESFIWATAENADFRYIFKCTDSTFALLREIMTELEARKDGSDDYLWGFFSGGTQATKEGRLGENNWNLCTHYLPYPEGGGYVISRELVSILHTLNEDLEHYIHDDIALGVWFSPFNGIERRHDVRFNTGYYSRGCNNVYLVTHKESASSMLRKHSSQTRTGVLCEKEFTAKPSYRYNWTVPSNRCCIRDSGVP